MLCISAAAQQSVLDKLTQPHNIDTNYIAMPSHKWQVGVSGRYTYSKFHTKIPIPESYQEQIVEAMPDASGLLNYDLDLHSDATKVGFFAGYGTLRASLGFTINNRDKSTDLSVECLGSKFGGLVNYHHSKQMHGQFYDALGSVADILVYNVFDIPIDRQEIIKENTTDVQSGFVSTTTLHMQGHYVANSKRFAYSAARTGTRLQTRSAGSFIALADFYFSRAQFKEGIFLGNNERFRTYKIAIGGGYGYNWTPNQGRFVLSASALPMLNLVSWARHKTQCPYASREDFFKQHPTYTEEEYQAMLNSYDPHGTGSAHHIQHTVNRAGRINFGLTARVAAIWNFSDHMFANAFCTYQYLRHKNKEDYRVIQTDTYAQLSLGYRF